MSARQDDRTGHWYFRKKITLPDRSGKRLFGVPTDYGQPDTKAGAEEAERIAIGRLRDARSTDPRPTAPAVAKKAIPTVAEFAPVWFAKSEGDDKRSTINRKENILRIHIVPRFGSVRLDQIDFAMIEAWRLELLSKKKKPATVLNLLTVFRSLLGYALKLGIIERLPRWPTQRSPEGRPKFLTFDACDRLIAAAEPMDPWKAMITVAARTGLRHGELTALRWQDIDLPGGKLSVNENYVSGHTGTPKSGHGREVPLSNDTIRALIAIRHSRGPLVFCNPSGRHLEHDLTDYTIRRTCDQAGLPRIGWHVLRHTFASHLAMRGVSLKTIQELLGHANFKMTMRYAHLMPEVRRDAVLLLDAPAPVREIANEAAGPSPSRSISSETTSAHASAEKRAA